MDWQTFSVKGQVVYMLSFTGHMVSTVPTQLESSYRLGKRMAGTVSQ